MDQRYVAIQFLQPKGNAVLVVVDFELGQRPLKLTLTVPEFAEHGLHGPPFVGDGADHLAKGLLATPDLVHPIRQIGSFVVAVLQDSPLFGIDQSFLDGSDCLFGIAIDEVLDRCVEVILRSDRNHGFLSRALDALAQ